MFDQHAVRLHLEDRLRPDAFGRYNVAHGLRFKFGALSFIERGGIVGVRDNGGFDALDELIAEQPRTAARPASQGTKVDQRADARNVAVAANGILDGVRTLNRNLSNLSVTLT